MISLNCVSLKEPTDFAKDNMQNLVRVTDEKLPFFLQKNVSPFVGCRWSQSDTSKAIVLSIKAQRLHCGSLLQSSFSCRADYCCTSPWYTNCGSQGVQCGQVSDSSGSSMESDCDKLGYQLRIAR